MVKLSCDGAESVDAFLMSGALWFYKEGCHMNTMEVLTLLLVIFSALTYIDHHNAKKN